ncbi:CorA family divalent cation transporter [Novosphingobium sp. BL-8H]|uniref:CorA family divalent cation transporter n=1 Tax=Novosphingobium sp. BL-8H TaxID=3127640 RepID=UPI0037578B02
MRQAHEQTPALGPGLIWGFEFTAEGSRPVEDCDSPQAERLRWLHLNLADHGTRKWVEATPELPAAAREVLLSQDRHQRALVDPTTVAWVLHDLERDFDSDDTGRIGALHMALTPNLIVSARHHPIGSADIVYRRLSAGGMVITPPRAVDLMASALLENFGRVIARLSSEVQGAEDALVEDRQAPNSHRLMDVRRRLAQLHRMLDGMKSVFRRLELDSDLPAELLPTIEKLSQRVQGVDGDIVSVLNQLRSVRDEINDQSNQRINQNLYLLSVMTALMLPTTLITGIFGMNTGDLPLTGHGGTIVATAIAAGCALATFVFLRGRGFFR